jgi:predicted DNA-binding ribbon-helix-helix protein
MPVKPVEQSLVVKRHVRISGRHTSISLETTFWRALGDIAIAKDTTRPRLINEINQTRNNANLSSAVRLFVLAYYRGSGRY